jgi:hypothetical protein
VLFTVEGNMGQRLQENDRELVRAIRFAAPKAAATAQNGARKSAQPK